jgi:uncharacterized protein with NRDE domain
MCTVSFIPVKDTVIITSNRDENIQRENAAAPDFHLLQNKKIIFPKDAKAGGTWFAAGDNGAVAVLLNGAFEKHVANPPYGKSRGMILLEIIEADQPISFFAALDLEQIEPFTVILYQPGSLHELRWDGTGKHEKVLNDTGNYIWSSSTLYTREVIEQRKDLFEQFIKKEKNITASLIHNFHAYDHGDDENGFVINRRTGMKTFSITQAVVKQDSIRFLHTDLLQQKKFEETMEINQSTINS